MRTHLHRVASLKPTPYENCCERDGVALSVDELSFDSKDRLNTHMKPVMKQNDARGVVDCVGSTFCMA